MRKIYESKNSIIYVGKHEDFSNEVIIKILKTEQPTEIQIQRFTNEYEFTNAEISGVRKALQYTQEEDKHKLILQYFDGQPFIQFIRESIHSTKVLVQIAIQIAQIIGDIHQQKIIHKDINPNNILINNENEIKIIDFGLATKYTLNTQNLANPEHLEGTLAYLSPEQTGRMNRSVDERTDLYSLGVVFYEMFTGQLPFGEKDKMELIHAHIAKAPKPLTKIKKEIPKILSDIILKLLSKNAENRYQSAFGLKHDLEQFNQSSNSFKLGEKDFSGKLAIPDKLFGREKETAKLNQIYEKVSSGKTELLLISGKSGSGKSALIFEIHKPLIEKKGFYIEGKFDKFQKNIPYLAVIQAFTNFVNLILKGTDDNLLYWKNLIQKAVGNVGRVLTNLIPELELIIGKQPELPELEGKEAQNRFNYVWSNFIKAISQDKHPLVIFIDNLQWADNSSIILLKHLLSDPEINYLFCIIASNNNEINKNDLQEFEKLENLNISYLKLENLKQTDVHNLINDTLNQANLPNYTSLKKLSDLVYSKTYGNPFFTVQFLKNLYEEELLKFDFEKNIWKWNLSEIEKQNITDNVVELMTNKVQKLPNKTQNILKIASCIGNKFNITFLASIYNKNKAESRKILQIAISEGLIISIEKDNYKFAQNMLQQAIYSEINESEKNNFHTKIGILMLADITKDNCEHLIFDLVNQLNFGKNKFNENKEKFIISSSFSNKTNNYLFAELNYKAAKKAIQSAAYELAFNYLKIASEALDKSSWEKDFDLTLQIYEDYAKSSYLITKYEITEEIVEIIDNNTTNVLHKINAFCSLINSYRVQNKYIETIDKGLQTLALLGIKFPKNPKQSHVIKSFIKTQLILKKYNYTKLSNLNLMTDKHKIAAIAVIQSFIPATYIVSPNLMALITLKSISIATKYGYSKGSIVLLSAYGLMLGTLNKIDNAIQFGELAEMLQEKHNLTSIKSSVRFMNLSFINYLKTKLHNILPQLIENHRASLEAGDLEFASIQIMQYSSLKLFCNSNINQIKKEAITLKNITKKFNLKELNVLYASIIQSFDNMTNNSTEPSTISGNYYNENVEITKSEKAQDNSALSRIYILKLFIAFIFNKSDKYQEFIDKLDKYKEGVSGEYYLVLIYLYKSLCLLEICNEKNKKSIFKIVNKNQKQMKIWAKHCPENFQHKYDLIEAEKYRIQGKIKLSADYYHKAISGAAINKFWSEEAISWELAANFYLSQKNIVIAQTYLQNSYKCYKRWGALTKCKQLENKYPNFHLQQNVLESSQNKKESTTSTIFNTSSSELDIASLVKATNSLSGEVKLEKLLKGMLQVTMENAGADYAVIITNEEGKFVIEAKGTYNKMQVMQSEDLQETKSVALNIVKYVIRTQKFIVIDDAQKDNNYSNNYYIQAKKVKSVFCYPIVHKDKLIAVLYLENNLSTHAFTAKRIEIINILSSQIAISIENALLYENLEDKVKSRTEELNEANEELNEINEELNQTNEELQTNINLVEKQKHEIEEQKAKIEQTHKKVTDSINYASRIQQALLPSKENFNTFFKDHFILFKPRNVVSGDFYYLKERNKHLIVAAADCTGHGVPGAFVSMLGISFLNEIINKQEIKTASQVLESLREHIKISLKQTDNSNRSQDGMDIALCIINTKTNQLQFAGAYNPLFIIRNNKQNEIKATRSPIGIYIKEKPFQNKKIQLQNNDKLYLFTDGYGDQFSRNKKKFLKSKFKKLLVTISNKPMNEQRQELDETIEKWKHGVAQTDDILVLGFKIEIN